MKKHIKGNIRNNIYMNSNKNEFEYRKYLKLNYYQTIFASIDAPDDSNVYATVSRCFSSTNLNRYISELKKTALSQKMSAYEKKSLISDLKKIESINDYEFENTFLRNSKLKSISFDLFKQLVDKELSDIIIPKRSIFEKKLLEIQTIFQLSDIEKEIIKTLFMINYDGDFEEFLSSILEGNYKRKNGMFKSVICHLTGLKYTEVTAVFHNKSNLTKYQLIDRTGNITPELAIFIDGVSDKPVQDRYFTKYSGKYVPINCFDKKDDIEFVKQIMTAKGASGSRFLFYGKPGTGKTELSRSIAKELGFDVYNINQNCHETSNDTQADDEDRPIKVNTKEFRFRALKVCDNIVDPTKSLIVIDEADSLLNTASFFGNATDDKGNINETLDNNRCNQIWIINHHDYIDESTKRRFNYCIEFNELNYIERKSIWQNIIKRYKLTKYFSKFDIENLSEKYHINAGVIERSLDNVRRLIENPSEDPINIMDALTKTLKSHIKLIYNLDHEKIENRKPNMDNYSVDGLNIKTDINKFLKNIELFNKESLKPDCPVKNMNILMWGPPGTGKTELAKYIARSINKKLIIKNASDILNPYVGMTEKYIKMAFKEAEEQSAILFIDEIDGLLSAREGAQRSWEVTQVNELLVNMENFRGVLICATNFMKNVDQAAIRRFNLKVEFDYLTSDGNIKFFNRIFEKYVSAGLSEDHTTQIIKMKNLTPGDFKVVFQKNIFAAADEVSVEVLIHDLEDEITAKSNHLRKQVGFV